MLVERLGEIDDAHAEAFHGHRCRLLADARELGTFSTAGKVGATDGELIRHDVEQPVHVPPPPPPLGVIPTGELLAMPHRG